ncbi:hypothetical protein F1880_008474 [Penicillium rolfsii]|nr:hypothetical protein F1880_008474 [Penicillium rolfsii]
MSYHRVAVVSEPKAKQIVSDRDLEPPESGEIGIRVMATAVNPVDWKIDEQAAGVSLVTMAVLTAFYSDDGHGLMPPWKAGGDRAGAKAAIVILGGASSVGQYAIQFARLSGFEKISTNASTSRHAFLRILGAHVILDRNASDTWPTLTHNPAERRRRQNRINQRAYRKPHASVNVAIQPALTWHLIWKHKRLQHQVTHPGSLIKSTTKLASSTSSASHQSQDSATPGASNLKFYCIPRVLQDLLEISAKSAIARYARGDPTADHLIVWTKVNVFRAFAQNVALIGWSPYWMDYDTFSSFHQRQLQIKSTLNDYRHVPPTLRPARVQKVTPHHPWLDFFPLPQMRDNSIEAGDEWDHEQLCHDIMGFWGESSMDSGLLVWAEPWDI